MSDPEPLGVYRAQVGESPWWDARRGVLWSVDVFAHALIRTDPQGVQTTWPMPEMTGGVATMSDGRLVLAMESGLFAFDPDAGGAPQRFSRPEGHPATHRFNDLTVDTKGRLIVGSMRKSTLGPEPTGVLYVFDGQVWRVLVEGLTTINGLATSSDGQTLYWSDSAPSVNRIWRADYDPERAHLSEAKLFCDMRDQRGRPDGAAMDAEGGYWIAAVGGGCLHRFAADGRIDRTVDLPVDHPTKPAFGGPDLANCFVTSLSIRESRDDNARAAAGAVTRLGLGVRGQPLPEARIAPSLR